MKSRHQLRREIAERSAALTARQLQWQSERAKQQQQRRAALVSPRWLAGSFVAGLTLGLLGTRRRARAEQAERQASAQPSLLLRTARDLLPVVQPLLLSAALQWWQLRQTHGDGDDHPQDGSPPR